MITIFPHDMAFPVPQSEAPNNSYQWGLTKREYFAGLALQALLANGQCENRHTRARAAVEHAEALIAELNKAQP